MSGDDKNKPVVLTDEAWKMAGLEALRDDADEKDEKRKWELAEKRWDLSVVNGDQEAADAAAAAKLKTEARGNEVVGAADGQRSRKPRPSPDELGL